MIYVQTTSVTVLSVVRGCSGPSQPYLQARTQQQTDLKNEHLQRLIDQVISFVSHL